VGGRCDGTTSAGRSGTCCIDDTQEGTIYVECDET
jgi:hypothetical protein